MQADRSRLGKNRALGRDASDNEQHRLVRQDGVAPTTPDDVGESDALAGAQVTSSVEVFAQMALTGAAPTAFRQRLVQAAQRWFHHDGITLAHPCDPWAD